MDPSRESRIPSSISISVSFAALEKVASVTPSVNVNIEKGDDDDGDAVQGVGIYFSWRSPHNPPPSKKKSFSSGILYLIGTQSGGYP